MALPAAGARSCGLLAACTTSAPRPAASDGQAVGELLRLVLAADPLALLGSRAGASGPMRLATSASAEVPALLSGAAGVARPPNPYHCALAAPTPTGGKPGSPPGWRGLFPWGCALGAPMIEREYYPLSMLAERWACTVQDLLHAAAQNRAQVCVNVYGMGSSTRTRLQVDADEDDEDIEPLTEQERKEAAAHEAEFDRWLARTTQNMPHGIFELMPDTLRFLEMPDSFPHELFEALKFDGGWWEVEFDPPVKIEQAHLCMLKEEVARLDRETFGAAPLVAQIAAGSSAIDRRGGRRGRRASDLDARIEATDLHVIGGLLRLLLDKTPTKGPSFRSQAAIIDALLTRYPNVRGLSKTVLEGRFAEAKVALPDAKDTDSPR